MEPETHKEALLVDLLCHAPNSSGITYTANDTAHSRVGFQNQSEIASQTSIMETISQLSFPFLSSDSWQNLSGTYEFNGCWLDHQQIRLIMDFKVKYPNFPSSKTWGKNVNSHKSQVNFQMYC